MMDKASIKNLAWLQIQPVRGVVKAGEKKLIDFRVQINQREAQFTFLYKELEELVKIKTNEPSPNNEHQINVICNYLKSCFGAALPILNQCLGIGN